MYSKTRSRLAAVAMGVALAAGAPAVTPIATPVVGTALVASADAATFELEQCTTQNPGVSGWESAHAGAWVYVGNDCPSGGGLSTAFDTNQAHSNGNTAQWSFNAPANTSLHSMSVASRQMRAGRPNPNGFGDATAFVIKNGATVLEDCVQLYGCGSRNGAQNYNFDGASSTTFGVQCTGGNGCPADVVNASMRGITMRLNDNLAPNLSGVSGSLTSTNTIARTRQLAFSATDQGGGVFRRRLIIDDVPQAVGTVDTNGGQCATPFRERVPCKLSASETFTFDTATLSDGTHDISLRVTDATDVNQAQSSEWTIRVDNQPPAFESVSVSGSAAQVGTELTCTPSAINGQNPTIAYQWYRANADGSGQQAISGATTNKYTPTSADSQKKLRCEVVATDGGGSTTRISPTTSGPFDNGATVQPAPVQPQPTPEPTPQPTPTPQPEPTPAPKPVDDTSKPAPGGSTSGGSTPGVGGTSGQAIADPGPANGTNGGGPVKVTAAWMQGGKSKATVRYGASPTIRGRVVNLQGQPVGGAILDVLATPTAAGAGALSKTGVRTTADGRFSLKLPRNVSSRTVKFVYRATLNAKESAGEAAVTLSVKAGLTLRVSQSRGKLVFTGRLLGQPFPKIGQLVEIQVAKGRNWQAFGRTVRAHTKTGKFRMTYSTAGVARGVVFRFRAVSKSTPSYPYLQGSSAVKRRIVR